MATPDYTDWIARGRAHQAAGRPVDAMLCFRRAARTAGGGVDAHFHLGEVHWQLSRFPEAIAAWREALRLDPRRAAPLQALAEALLAVGEWAAAREAAERVRTLVAGDPRASVIVGVASLLLADGDPGAAAASVTDALARDPRLVAVPTLAGPLATALDGLSAGPVKVALLDAAGRAAVATSGIAATPALLHALLCEHATDTGTFAAAPHSLFADAVGRGFSAAEHDALRRIARSAARTGDTDATQLARNYAALCIAAFAVTPIAWPRRTAGAALRVVALCAAVPSAVAESALAVLAGLPRNRVDCTVAVLGAASGTDIGGGLPLMPMADDAKRVAASDPDVLIDLAGLDAAAGPVLARRPARTILSPSDLPAPNLAPLVDRADVPASELPRVLAEMQIAVPEAGEVPDAAAMRALWEDAVRAHQQGAPGVARGLYTRVLAMQPGYAPAHYLYGVALRDDGEPGNAGAEFAAAIAAAPGFVDARVAAAIAAQQAGDAPLAAALCAEGFAHTTDHAPLCRALGEALLAAHDGAGAEEAFAAALALTPADGQTHFNHGVALQMQHRLADAARAYQRALAFRPDLTAAEFNLGALFQQQGATDAACVAYQNVVDAEPANAAAYKSLGEVLFGAGRMDAWYANFRRFEANCPDALSLAVQALEVCQFRGDLGGVDRYLEGLSNERYRPTDERDLVDNLEQLLYLLLFFDVDPAIVFRFAQTYDAAAQRVYGTPLPRPAERRPGRLRVGYLSADLRNHVMGKMMWQAVENHDRSRFSLHFYSLSAERDALTERFESIADRFAVVAQSSEREAASRIADDDLDLLVDLSTHTKGAKPGILALKPARVIATHVASAGTVGLSSIDFKLTDRYADVADNQASQFETLLPVDGCVYPYRHIPAATTHPFHRAALGVAADAVLIGAFVTPMKLSRRCLGLWREVLQRIRRAMLVFSPVNPAFRDSYVRLAAAAGIAPDRLSFLPQGRDDSENQARYGLIDFTLDPLPFGGANGTIESLDMGVPVVTLAGKRHGERVGLSILANLGVGETVAQSGPEYVDLAVRLADDPAFMRDVRAAIAAGLARSPLTDRVAHTRALERAYVAAIAARAPDALRAAEDRYQREDPE